MQSLFQPAPSANRLACKVEYESSFKPKVLQNWEVPKIYPLTPRKRSGKTKVISNDRGHLLPEIKSKIKNKQPWGNYLCTWRLPKKIDRKTADEISGLARLKKYKKSRMQVDSKTQKDEKSPRQQEQPGDNSNQVDLPKAIPYVPGDLTDEKYRSEDYHELAANRYNDKEPEIRRGYPRVGEDFSMPPEPEQDLSQDVEEFIQEHKEMLNETYCPEKHKNDYKELSKKNKFLSPLIAAISNFNLAKKLHKENLEHNPLPDTITDSMYRKLQMQREQEHEPGLSLEDKNYACAVGWKGFPGYGPTKCTKLKVYRPKTCDHVKKTNSNHDDRPSSSVESFDRKWRFIRQSKVSPIDLAIYWDMVPEDPKDEPKRTTHIDGSNGSMAPAVFTLVHTPKEETEEKERHPCDGVHRCGPIFDHGARANQEKDFIFDRPRTSVAKESRKSSASSSKASDKSKKRTRSAHNVSDHVEKVGSHSSCGLRESKVHQSTPNLSDESGSIKPCKQHTCKKLGRRLCVACELKNISDERPGKSEYKMAFKAGVPNLYVSSRPRWRINVPKPHVPYGIKSYAIHSLAAPFSLQNNKRQDYPEHWRLATVYQHSYKPMQARKKPLLQTVYK